MSMLVNFGGGCVAFDDTVAFGCDERLTHNCVLGNGTAGFNCTTICSTPGLFFENYYTYEYCAPNDVINNIGNGLTLDAANAVLPQINACMQQYCEEPFDGLGGCPWSNLTSTEDYAGAICANITATVDLDLAGPGVLISYLMQTAIVLAGWALLRCMELLTWLLHFRLAAQVVFHYRRLGKMLRFSLEAPFARQIVIIQSMFVEFQEAQCFFILATQIATTFVLSKSLILLESYSIIQLQANKIILILVARSSIAVATFGLLILHLANLASLYMVILSSGTVILALYNVVVAMRNSSVLDFTKPPGFQSAPNCGEGPPPIAYCSAGASDGHGDFTIIPTLLSSPIQDFLNMEEVWQAISPIYPFAFVLFIIFLSRYNAVASVRSWYRRLSGQYKGRSWFPVVDQLPASQTSPTVPLLRICMFILEVIMLVYLGWYVGEFRRWRQLNVVDMSSWQFGQIIALFVWAPIFCKYFYWSILGMEEHSAVRIAKPYHITKIEEQLIFKRVDGDDNEKEIVRVQPGASATIDDTPESQHSLLSTSSQTGS
ncbi:hypothetical protein B7463_g3404, partial [Scytalidium lignicola]